MLSGGSASQVTTDYILTKVLSSTSDDLSYDNRAEVSLYGNIEGRRMYSILPANDNSYEGNGNERDQSDVVTVSVIPPLGENNAIYYVLAITSIALLGVGIVLIKKYVIKK